MTKVKQYKLHNRITGQWLHQVWDIDGSRMMQWQKDPNGAYCGTRKKGKKTLQGMVKSGMPKESLGYITFIRYK